MAKKSKPGGKPEFKTLENQERRKQVVTSSDAATPWYKSRNQLLVIGAILLLTFIAYSPTLIKEKEFINWDDDVYISNQPIITQLDQAHLHAIFTEPVSLNYHPLTMLSLAINYHFSQLNPFGYFLTNIVIHLLNTFLVFIFLYRLSGRKFWVGALPALFFGIHPMHVESVAWASERKDVLYCFFLLGSCISYLSWIDKKKWGYLLICFLLFVFSCLSKAMAAPMPVLLFLVDFYRQRKFTFASVAEKIPFLCISLWLGLKAVSTQSQGAIVDFRILTVTQHLMFASYSFIMYWVKLFIPFGLSSYYPYPVISLTATLPVYYLAPFVALAMVIVPAWLAWKKNKEIFRLYIFSMGFFISMVAMVLQFVSIGPTIMSDRYTYLPYIGATFLLASLLNPTLENAKTKMLTLGTTGVVSSVFFLICYNRVQVWQNSDTLWSDVIDKYPYVMEQRGDVTEVIKAGVDDAYENLGVYWYKRGDIDKAMADYEVPLKAQTKNYKAWSDMGYLEGVKGDFGKAFQMYAQAIKLNPDKAGIYENRASTYDKMGKHQESLDDFNTALKLKGGNDYPGMKNIAFQKLQMGKWEDCVADCNRLVAINAADGELYYFRGTAKFNAGDNAGAIDDLLLAVKASPDAGNFWYNLSFVYKRAGNKAQALQAALNAQQKGYNVTEAYLQELRDE